MCSCWFPSDTVQLHTTACIEAKLNPEEQLYNEPMFQARIDVAEILDSVQCQVAEPVEKEDQVLSPCEIKWRKLRKGSLAMLLQIQGVCTYAGKLCGRIILISEETLDQ